MEEISSKRSKKYLADLECPEKKPEEKSIEISNNEEGRKM